MEQNNYYSNPDCFIPEENNPYPLCIGNGSEECNQCCLFKDLDYLS